MEDYWEYEENYNEYNSYEDGYLTVSASKTPQSTIATVTSNQLDNKRDITASTEEIGNTLSTTLLVGNEDETTQYTKNDFGEVIFKKIKEQITATIRRGDDVINGTVSNGSTLNAVFSQKLHTEWLSCEILSYILLVVNVYLLICLTVYYIRKGGLVTRNSYFFSNKSGSQYSIALNSLTVASAIFTAIRLFLNLDTIWGRSTELTCVHLKKPKILIGFLAYGAAYINFWVRQRIFYSSPQLKHLSNKLTRFISKWILLLLVLGYFANLAYFMISDSSYKSLPPNGCSVSSDNIPWYLLTANSVSMQFTLLALLMYPILMRKSVAKSNGPNMLLRFVRKVFIGAVFAVICCLISLVVIVFVPTPVDEISFCIIDVNLTILVCIGLIMFSDWRVRIFPFRQQL